MFYNKEHNQYINENTAFVLNGIQYPANWLNLSTAEDKANIGLVEVKTINTPADDRFYWVSTELVEDTLTYINTPKELNDVDGGLGLKTQWVNQVKSTVYSILQPNDYIEVRNIKDPTYKPEWVQWRESILNYSKSVVANISLVSTVEELITIVNSISWPSDPNSNITIVNNVVNTYAVE